MPDPIDAHALMATLRGQLDLLKEMLCKRTVHTTVYEIPLYDNGEVPDYIEPKRHTGQVALDKALSAIRGMSRPNTQHP